jgi:hypothetical protein
MHNSKDQLESPLDSFDAVYYPQLVPASAEVLTLLAFIFDRVYFPGVYMPDVDLDEEAVKKEIQRIQAFGSREVEDRLFLASMGFALQVKHVRDFCIFTGTPGILGTLEPGAQELVMQLEELLFGPPPPNFLPAPQMGFCKGLPGKQEPDLRAQVNGPSWLSYPANALVFAGKHGLLLVNDNPTFPVPGLKNADPKANAKLLATILAIESVHLVLPKLKALAPRDLQEFREQTSQYIKPFRLAMLRLAKDLNAAIRSEMTLSDVQKEARFIVETSVFPELKELEKVMHDPGTPWYRRAVDLAKTAPELVSSFIAMPTHLAFAKVFARIAEVLADLRDEQLDKEHKLGRGGLYYLLKVRDKGAG